MKLRQNEHPDKLDEHRIDYYTNERLAAEGKDFRYVKCYYHTHDPLYQFPILMHSHIFFEINIIVSGEGYHYTDSNNFPVKEGDALVIPPDFKHGYYTNDPKFVIFHILMSQAFLERYQEELTALPGYNLLFKSEPFIRRNLKEKMVLHFNNDILSKLMNDFDELTKLGTSTYGGKEIIQISKVLYLLCIFSKEFYKSQKAKFNALSKRTDSVAIVHSMEYIASNYHNKITLDTLYKLTDMSRSSFLRKFKEICRCTPQEYIEKIRLEKAKDMLTTSDSSITEIALDCGFYDNSHFSHLFKKYYGTTPIQYRKNN